MRIKITKGGIYGSAGEIQVGEEFDIQGEPPVGWKGRYEVVHDRSPGSQPVTNPAGQQKSASTEDLEKLEKAEVLERLEKLGWDGDKRQGVEKLRADLAELQARS